MTHDSTTKGAPLVGVALAGVAFLALSPAPLLAAGEGGSGSALFDINVGLSLWTVVIFLALLFILWRFAWDPILAQVDARHDRIQGALDEAARKQSEAQELLEEHRRQLADARRQAQEIIAEGKAAGEKVRRDIEARAREEGEAMLERARADIRREKEAALAELRRESVDLALAAAGRLMSERMDREKDREMVMSYLDRLRAADEETPSSTAGASA